MNKRLSPYIIGIPNMGVGMLWAMNLILIPLLAGTILLPDDPNYNKKLAVLISMGAFTGIFIQYFAGLLSDRCKLKMGRRKPFILAGVLVASLMMCIMPFIKNYNALFFVALVFYISVNFYQGPYYSMIPETVDETQIGLANGFSKVISILGSAIVFVAGPILWTMDKRYPFFLAAALSILSVIGTVIFVKEKTDIEFIPESFKFDFYKHKTIMELFSLVFLVFFAYGCITPFFVKYCLSYTKFTESQASTGMLVLTIAGAIFAYPIGILADKISKKKVFGLGVILFALALFALIFMKTIIGLYLFLSLIGVGFIAIQITIYAICAQIVTPERMGEFMGIMNMFISFGQFASNNIMGAILDKFGYGIFFLVPAVIMLTAGILIFRKLQID